MDHTNQQNISKSNEKLVDLFRWASRLMARSYHRREHSHHAQARVLTIIQEKGSINQRELLEILDVRSSSLSEVLGKLERSGQIVRKKNEEDKRSFIITAADEAQAPGEGPADVSGEGAESPFACLDDQERQQLGNILEKLVQTLKDDSRCQDFANRDRRHWKGSHRQGSGRGKLRGFNPAECGGGGSRDHRRSRTQQSRSKHGAKSDSSAPPEKSNTDEKGAE